MTKYEITESDLSDYIALKEITFADSYGNGNSKSLKIRLTLSRYISKIVVYHNGNMVKETDSVSEAVKAYNDIK